MSSRFNEKKHMQIYIVLVFLFVPIYFYFLFYEPAREYRNANSISWTLQVMFSILTAMTMTHHLTAMVLSEVEQSEAPWMAFDTHI